MIDYKKIENEYLSIEPYDKKKIFKFYDKNKTYFNNSIPTDIEELKIFLLMLSEIGSTYSLDNQHSIALEILNRTIKTYNENQKKLIIDLNKEASYNSALWNKGYTLFQLKKYLKAKYYITKSNNNNHSISQNDIDFLKLCKLKIKNRIAIATWILGLLMIVVKYLLINLNPENKLNFINYLGIAGAIFMVLSIIAYLWKINTASNTA